jgi:Putative MetA-pathway of phenol degradation
MMTSRIRALFLSLIGAGGFLATAACADTVLETETAELGRQGEWLISNSMQFERGPEGRGRFTLFQYEYALSDRGEILIEPFFQEWVSPKDGENFQGAGDLEITPSYMISLETERAPAIVLALKVKVPTARNLDIGTREFDYYPYIILGKHYGDWTFNANLGVDFIGRVDGEQLRNQGIYDISAERRVSQKLSFFGEIFGNTSAARGEHGTVGGAIAFEYQLTKHFNYFVSVGYDSDDLFNIRPGFNIHY